MGLMLPTARTLRDLYKTEIAAGASGKNFMASKLVWIWATIRRSLYGSQPHRSHRATRRTHSPLAAIPFHVSFLIHARPTQGRRKLPLLGQRLPPLFRRSCRNRSRHRHTCNIINAITSATNSTAAAAITAAIAADSAVSASVATTPPPPHSQCSPPYTSSYPCHTSSRSAGTAAAATA